MPAAAPKTFLGHLEVLRGVLFRCALGIGVMLAPGFLAAPHLVSLLIRYSCPPGLVLNYFSPLEPFVVQMKLGFWIAFTIALPYSLWQFGAFAAPGLYRRERRVIGRAVAAAMVLFLAGAVFALLAVVPLLMRFSWSLATPELRPVIGIGEFIGLVTLLTVGFGLMFQLPVLMVVATRGGLIDVAVLRAKRPFVVVGIFIAAAVLTPPDVVSQLFLALPTWLLFELALLFCGKTGGAVAAPDVAAAADEDAAAEPDSAINGLQDLAYRRAARKKRPFIAINGHQGGSRGEKRGKK